MGERGRVRRTANNDEAVEARVRPAKGDTSLNDHVLGLQRDYGNAAVTTAVQRKPHSKAASTDAPGVKKKKGKPVVKDAEIVDYRPKEGSKQYNPTDWPDARLEGWIHDHADDATGASLKDIGRMYEELYYRHPDFTKGLNLYRVFKKIGDTNKADFWMAFMNSRGHLLDPKPEDMSGKEF
jgi:hypothetical protein